MKKKILKLTMAIALGCSAILPTATSVNAKEEVQYEIYPTPHNIEYKTDSFIIRKDVNVVWEDHIDEYTKTKLETVLKQKGITMHDERGEIQRNATNILVGTKGSKGIADSYMEENVEYDQDTFQHFDPYVLDVNNGTITIVGNDTNGAYYGIVSLMHVLNQMEGRTIRNFTIEDYSDTQTRGFIEGYYGIPWSNADRISLMKFGGDFKMTSYVFAPKDDPYHKDLWREPYPADEFEEVKKMVQAGIESKCRFVWTAHPFMGGFDANDVDGEIQALLKKFEQLYEAGVRQFGVLGDDVGKLDKNVVIRIMNEVSEWGKEKGDVYDPVFCPAGYNDAWQGDYSELNTYDKGFPEDVQIFWTGQAVCQPVEQQTLTNFRTKNLPEGAEKRRAPLFWLNWPVNDINMSRLLMGKGSLLHPDINVEDIKGVVTNPMQDAQASKVALFAIADYAWNVKGFNMNESWADSFKYIDPNAADALHTLAKHMSDPSPNGHGLVLEESEELKPLLDEFLSDYRNGELNKEVGAQLVEEFETIQKACVDFHKLSKNDVLKSELLPFTKALSDLAEANISLIETAFALEEGRDNDVWTAYSNAISKLSRSESYDRKILDGTKKAMPGSKRLRPFASGFNDLLAGPVNSIIDDSKVITLLITNRTDTPSGALEKLTDNDEGTQVIWQSPNSTTEGTYIGLSYSRPITLNDVTFKMGQSGNMKDTFREAKIQYTEDGKTWVDLAGSAYTDERAVVTVDNLNLKVKGVRLISTADKGNMWLGCRDIIVNKDSYEKPEKPEEGPVAGTGFYNTENMVIRNGKVDMMTDGVMDRSTNDYVGFAKSKTNEDPDKDTTVAGAYVGIRFDKVEEVTRFVVNQGTGDHIVKGTLQYQDASDNWHDIASYDNIGADFDETFAPVKAKALRLVNNEKAEIWWRIYEMTAYVGNDLPLNKTIIKTSIWSVYSGGGPESNLTDGNEDTMVWYNTGKNPSEDREDDTLVGDYLGMDLGRVVPVGDVTFVVGNGDGDKWKQYKLEYSADDVDNVADVENWTTVKEYTGVNSGKDVHKEDLQGKLARYVRITNMKKEHAWVKFGEFNVEKYVEPTFNENIFTNSEALQNLETEISLDRAEILPQTDLTLKPNEYVGLKLERIKDITGVEVETNGQLTLQYSKNSVVWKDVATGMDYEDARYIRVINKTNADVTFDLSEFVVTSHELEAISIESKNINFYDGGDGLNAFDHDRNSQVIFNHSQVKGDYITYDLGRTLKLNSLKLVDKDSDTDFPRHAKISVSKDNNNWETVMTIGNQDGPNKGELENTDVITDVLPVHEVSYNTKETTGLDLDIRYVKFEITRNKVGADKWTRFTEIELNGGNLYLPTENDPTVISTGGESTDNVPKYVIDGEVSTTYKPVSDEAGSLTYFIPDAREINKLSILQSPDTVSNALVTLEVLDGDEVKSVKVGRLNSSMNEFDTSMFTNVLSVKVEWESGKAPKLHEIITSTTEVKDVDTSALEAFIAEHKNVDTSNWTDASRVAWETALACAEEFLTYSNYATPVSVASMFSELQKAFDQKVEKPDKEAYLAELNEIQKDVLGSDNYIASTWQVYSERLTNAIQASTDETVSQADLDELLAKLEEAKAGLVFEVTSIEDLTVLCADLEDVFNQDDYTKVSYQSFETAFENAKAILEADKVDRVPPKDVKAATNALDEAVNELVSIVALRDTVKEAKAIDTDGYVDITVKALNDKIVEAEALLKKDDASKEEVSQMLTALEAAMDALAPIEALKGVEAELKRLEALSEDDYTEVSYQALVDKIAEIKELLKTETDYATYLEQLKVTEEALVDVTVLREALDKAEALDKDNYSKDTLAVLEEAIANAEEVLVGGTVEEVAEAVESMNEAFSGLRYSKVYVEKALVPYAEALKGSYTTASKKALEDQLNAMSGKELTPAELVEAIAVLDQLKALLVDTTDLVKAIEEAEKVEGDAYTSASFKAYQELIVKAKALLENGSVTEIADAVEHLNDKDGILVEKADNFDELEAILKEYKGKDFSGFTEESKKALLDALHIAEFMLETKDFSKAEVAVQIKAIKDAYAALVKLPDISGGDGSDDVATGDVTDVAGLMFMMLLSAGAYVVLRNKKRA